MSSVVPALTFGRVRIGHAADHPRARRVLDRLGALEPDPPGPPAEVLIVRRLADPLPGGLARDNRSWGAALSGALTAARARAAWPARGPVDPGADAVAFADEAEALACLLEDRVRGRAAARWWWRAFPADLPAAFRGAAQDATASAAVEALLLRRPELAVATLATLADRGSVAEVVVPLAPEAALRLVRAIGAPLPPAPGPAQAAARAMVPAPAAARRMVWRGVSAPAVWLVAAALALRERPGAPPETLARRIGEILGSGADPEGSPPGVPAPPARTDRSSAALRAGKADAPQPRADEADAPQPMPAVGPADRRPPPAPAERMAARSERDAAARRQPTAREEDAAAGDESREGEPEADCASVPHTVLDAAGGGVATALAGTFFLVNLLDRPDLAPPLPEPAEVGPWALLDLLARALAGPQRAAEDTLWRLLAALDGRPVDAAPDPALWPRLADALPRLRERLATAMQLPADDAAEALLHLPGRVFATPVHLDVVIPMAELRLPIRRAGLDLDPGWSPHFGRIVAFHYRD